MLFNDNDISWSNKKCFPADLELYKKNAIKQNNINEHRIDQFLEISITLIIILASMFMLFVVVATATNWLPWKINVAHLLK
jgi:hypothetical protein